MYDGSTNFNPEADPTTERVIMETRLYQSYEPAMTVKTVTMVRAMATICQRTSTAVQQKKHMAWLYRRRSNYSESMNTTTERAIIH